MPPLFQTSFAGLYWCTGNLRLRFFYFDVWSFFDPLHLFTLLQVFLFPCLVFQATDAHQLIWFTSKYNHYITMQKRNAIACSCQDPFLCCDLISGLCMHHLKGASKLCLCQLQNLSEKLSKISWKNGQSRTPGGEKSQNNHGENQEHPRCRKVENVFRGRLTTVFICLQLFSSYGLTVYGNDS